MRRTICLWKFQRLILIKRVGKVKTVIVTTWLFEQSEKVRGQFPKVWWAVTKLYRESILTFNYEWDFLTCLKSTIFSLFKALDGWIFIQKTSLFSLLSVCGKSDPLTYSGCELSKDECVLRMPKSELEMGFSWAEKNKTKLKLRLGSYV